MREWILESVPLAQEHDFSEWAYILFLVVVAVFSAVGGLIKNAEAKKRQRAGRGASQQPSIGQQRETWQQRLARKAEEMQRAIEAKYGQTPQERSARPPSGRGQPRQGKLAIQTGRSGKPIMVFEEAASESMARPQAATERQTREAIATAKRRAAKRRLTAESKPGSHVAARAIDGQRPLSISATVEPPPGPTSYGAASIIDYDDPDSLRKAILHYEILGKPLAWRDPLERTSGF